jgi:hypothetical protein
MPGMKRDMGGSAAVLCAFVAAVKGAAQSVSKQTAQTCFKDYVLNSECTYCVCYCGNCSAEAGSSVQQAHRLLLLQ